MERAATADAAEVQAALTARSADPSLTPDDLVVEFGDVLAFDRCGGTRDAKFRAIRYDHSTGLKTARSVAALRAKVLADVNRRSTP